MVSYTFVQKGREHTIQCRSIMHAMQVAAKHHENQTAIPDRIAGMGKVYSYTSILQFCQSNNLFK